MFECSIGPKFYIIENELVYIEGNIGAQINSESNRSYNWDFGFDEYYDVQKKGYMVVTGYNGNSKWNEDKKDGVLENTEFGASTYSHIIATYDNSPETKNEISFVETLLNDNGKICTVDKLIDII